MMRPNLVQERLRAGKPVINAWLSIPSSYSAEGMGHAGFHSVTVDMQHGMIGFSDALHMLQALSSTPAVPFVRVRQMDPTAVMQALDAGAYGVICPMVSTPAQTQELVAACRYMPQGNRSFGPARGLLYGGPSYVEHANATVMPIPMIETPEAVQNIDAILAVEGIELIYIGPNDMALTHDGRVTGPRPRAEAAIAHVLARARAVGIAAGIFCADAAEAQRRLDQGFALVTPGNDMGMLQRAAVAAVTALADATDAPLVGQGGGGRGY